MNLKKTVLSLLAAGTLLMGGIGVANAQDKTTEADGQVTINNTGEFEPYFCETLIDFGAVNPSASAQTIEGAIGICFTDTISWRSGFEGTITASGWSAGIGRTMPASALTIVSVTGVGQTQWSSAVCPGEPVWGVNRPCVADIGAQTPSTHHNGGLGVAVAWTGPNFGTSNLLVTKSKVEGRGTLSSGQGLNVELTIPANQPAGVYTSTFTYDVVYTANQP